MLQKSLQKHWEAKYSEVGGGQEAQERKEILSFMWISAPAEHSLAHHQQYTGGFDVKVKMGSR